MPSTTDSFGAQVMADNAARSDFFRTTNGWNVAGDPPSADDLGLVECVDCSVWIDEAVSHLGCGEARGCCDSCHEAACSDRECRT